MKHIIISSQAKENFQKTIATIGNFDGVHFGHVQLLSQLSARAKQINAWRVLITFDRFSHEYFSDLQNIERKPRLSLLRDKIAKLKQLDLVDEVVLLHFNSDLSKLSPDKFVINVLKNHLAIDELIVGRDFRFGYKASGTIDDVAKHNIATQVFNDATINGVRVSSSIIRDYITRCDLASARTLLGNDLRFTSRVVYGNQIGRKYGVPTINLALGKICPAVWGIFVAYVYIDGVRYQAVASVGKNPTVTNEDNYKLEAHLLDIDMNLYGKIATIEFIHFLRGELKFANLDELFKQIDLDLKNTRNYFLQCK